MLPRGVLRKVVLVSSLTLFISILIPTTIKAQFEKPVKSPEEAPKTVQYAPGEVLVKFKEGTDPQAVLQAVNLETKSMERVYSIKPAVTKFKKTAKLERDSKGWYWFLGKKYKEADEIPDEKVFQEAYKQMPEEEKSLYRTYRIDLPENVSVEQAMVELKKDPDVEYAHPNYIIELYMVPNDPYYSSTGSWGQAYDDLWGLKPDKLNCTAAWDISQGEGVTVAVIDTGIDYNHEDIAANVWINTKELNGLPGKDDDGNGYVDDIRGWNFDNDSNHLMDGYGHGTHVAGIIAALGNNGKGIIGVAPKAKIMAVKAFDNDGYGLTSDLVSAIRYAVYNGADVINMSWGSGSDSSLLKDVLDYAYSLGCTLVAAAGNYDLVTKHYPAAYENVIAAGASDYLDKKASFSNFGSWVDVLAPGRSILSLRAQGTTMGQPINSFYTVTSGTSMASPHVAGLCALLLAKNPNYSNKDVADIIRMSADDIGTSGWDFTTAYGRIDAFAACSMPYSPILLASITAPVYDVALKGNIVSIQGTASGQDFSYYELEYIKGALSGDWIDILTNNIAVNNGELGKWDISNLSDGIFVIKLTVFGRNGLGKKAFVRRVFVSKTEEQGWPVKVPGRITSSPAIADVDRDGYLDIAIGAMGKGIYDGLYYLFNYNGAIKQGWPAHTANWNDNSPLLADLNKDGYYEVITLSLENPGVKTCVWDYRGNLFAGWPKDSIGGSFGSTFGFVFFQNQSPTAFDINQDGYYEILSQDYGDALYIYDGNGSLINGWPPNTEFDGSINSVHSVPAILKDKSSGACRIFIPVTISNWGGDDYEGSSKIFGFNSNGTVVPGWPVDLPYDMIDEVKSAVCDLNSDGKEEMIFSLIGWTEYETNVFYGELYVCVLNSDGTFVSGWPKIMDYSNATSGICVADINDDNRPEIILTRNLAEEASTLIEVYNYNGSMVAGWPKKLPYTDYISYPTIGDVDGDGHSEILVCVADYQSSNGIIYPNSITNYRGKTKNKPDIYATDKDERVDADKFELYLGASEDDPYYTGKLYALRGNGSILAEWPIPTGFASSAVTICDFDKDGKVEIILPDYNGWIHAWEFGNYNKNTMEWPMYRHDPQHTGRYDTTQESPNKPPVASITSIVPNPAYAGDSVTFTGNATDPDTGDTITAYKWTSSRDGVLSDKASFTKNTLSIGTHTITFEAQDNHGAWSNKATKTLEIKPKPGTFYLSLQNDQTVSGNIFVTMYSDGNPLPWFQFIVDGQYVGYNPWMTQYFKNGPHVVYGQWGLNKTTPITVNINNAVSYLPEIISPANGAKVSGNVNISFKTVMGQAYYAFIYINGKIIGGKDLYRLASPYYYMWDTTKLPNGEYELKVLVYYFSIGATFSNPIKVTVNNTATPPTPTLNLTCPNPASKTVNIHVSSSADNDFFAATLYMDGKLINVQWWLPCDMPWDTTKFTNGNHNLHFQVYNRPLKKWLVIERAITIRN